MSTVLFVLSIVLTLCGPVHNGFIKSTISSCLWSGWFGFSGSSIPIVIVLSKLKFPLLSTIPVFNVPSEFNSPAGNDNVIAPLYPTPFCTSRWLTTSSYLSPIFVGVPFTV